MIQKKNNDAKKNNNFKINKKILNMALTSIVYNPSLCAHTTTYY